MSAVRANGTASWKAGPRRFHTGAERLRRRQERDVELLQSLFTAGRPRAVSNYHLPMREPPYTITVLQVAVMARLQFCEMLLFARGLRLSDPTDLLESATTTYRRGYCDWNGLPGCKTG